MKARINIQSNIFEIEVSEGLEWITREELLSLDPKISILQIGRGFIRFYYDGDVLQLLKLGTIISVYSVNSHPIPRPRGLLGHQHMANIIQQIDKVRHTIGKDKFKTFFISAAGSDSSVMKRIRQEIGQLTGMAEANSQGDLLIRIRPDVSKTCWETLVRLTPRPIATRSWRVANMEGALHGPVARAMAILSEPTEDDIVLNIACGSGSLLIERCAIHQPQLIIGCDISSEALKLSSVNIQASHLKRNIQLLQADATQLPFPKEHFKKLLADLPFGQLTGDHKSNRWLYPQILAEAARVTVNNGIFVFITHEIRLTESVLRQSRLWQTKQILRVNLNGLHPRIFVLKRV